MTYFVLIVLFFIFLTRSKFEECTYISLGTLELRSNSAIHRAADAFLKQPELKGGKGTKV